MGLAEGGRIRTNLPENALVAQPNFQNIRVLVEDKDVLEEIANELSLAYLRDVWRYETFGVLVAFARERPVEFSRFVLSVWGLPERPVGGFSSSREP